MFFLGVLALFQILLFPGLIFKALFKPKGKFFFQISVIVAVSMLFNTLLFYALFYLHLYTRVSVLVVIILEVAALAYLYRGIFRTRLDETAKKVQDYVEQVFKDAGAFFNNEKFSPFQNLLLNTAVVIFIGLALSLTVWFVRRGINNIGTVFVNWDAIVSWNAWAQDWAQGVMPNIHLTYPQLIPINLSLTYVLIGDYQITLFAKAVMGVFIVLTALTLLELSIERKKYGYLFAVVLLYLLDKKFMIDFLTDGYADIPVAFMAWITLIPFLTNDDLYHDRKDFILSILLAAAAGMTKQVGLYVLALIPLAAFLQTKLRSKKQTLFCLAVLGVGILLVLTWYLPRGLDVLQGLEESGWDRYIRHAADVQDSSSPIMRIGSALLGLGKYVVLFALLLPAIFMLEKKFKILILAYLIPYTLLWGAIASYAVRNLSLIFPLLAVICGLTLAALMEYGIRFLGWIKVGRWSSALLVLLALLPIVYLGLRWSDEKLTFLWEEEQRQIFAPEINEAIYALDFSRDQCQKVLTNYPVDYLPGMEGRETTFLFKDNTEYYKYITDPTICYMLVPMYFATDEVKADIDEHLADGTYQLLFSSDYWVPYDLVSIR